MFAGYFSILDFTKGKMLYRFNPKKL
jgi:hypothetical protein